MTQLDLEIQLLKAEVKEMWTHTLSQLLKAKESLLTLDKDLARDVISGEKRVNAYELNIDRKCENMFALFNPVAVDLRYVLAVLKINSNLERIGDNIESIAKFVVEFDTCLDERLLKATRLIEMYDEAIEMLSSLLVAFENEDTAVARSIFKKDEVLDEINMNANNAISECIFQNKELVEQGLYVLSIIKKLERVGDQSKNISEEIIFYVEAKVLKHLTEIEVK